MSQIICHTDFSYMDEPDKTRCEQIQAKMLELLPTKKWEGDALWLAASNTLGNEDEQYCRIYICQECRQIYHGDYSTNSDPDRDFCGTVCEYEFLQKNPKARYKGELLEQRP